MNKEQLDAIDKVLLLDQETPMEGKDAPWYTSVLEATAVDPFLQGHGVRGYVPVTPLKFRSRLERSRWIAVDELGNEGVMRVVPELHFRATLEHGTLSDKVIPFWKEQREGGPTLLAHRSTPDGSGSTRARSNAYGFPAGTKEYKDAYRAANPDKFRSASRKYAKKLREDAKRMRELTKAGPAADKVDETATAAPIVGISPIEALAARMGLTLGTQIAEAVLGEEIAHTPIPGIAGWKECPNCEGDIPDGATSCDWCGWKETI